MLLQILKKSSLLIGAGAVLFFTSCNEGEEENVERENSATESTEEQTIQLKEIKEVEDQELDMEVSSEGQEGAIEISPMEGNNTVGDADAKINPPHGEPGHDCAVPVGQPLPSSDGSVNTPMNNESANLNPPHGEPGHDCSVPVGKPLN